MTVQTIATLRTNMPVGVTGAISAQDINDLIDTVEERTIQANLLKTANYSATVADNRRFILFNSASGVTLTLPNTLPEGWECGIIQMGAGAVTISVAGSPPLSRAGHNKTAGQYAQACVLVTSNSNGTSAQVVLGGDTST